MQYAGAGRQAWRQRRRRSGRGSECALQKPRSRNLTSAANPARQQDARRQVCAELELAKAE